MPVIGHLFQEGSDPVAQDVPVDNNGNVFIEIFSNGEYAISVQARLWQNSRKGQKRLFGKREVNWQSL